MNITKEEETSICLEGEWNFELATKLSDSWLSALAMEHKLPDWIRYMNGMSGKKYRYLINNFISKIEDARYLEIGSWKGSTACSAVYGNRCKFLCIDNWSDFLWGAPKENVKNQFVNNVKMAAADTAEFNYIDSDFRNVDYSNIGKYNIYMFDGPHSKKDHYDGIVLAQPALENQYVLIVDDWNVHEIRESTKEALNNLESKVLCNIEIITRQDGHHPVISMESSDWHNGYFLAIIEK